jgi:hypothetical protein
VFSTTYTKARCLTPSLFRINSVRSATTGLLKIHIRSSINVKVTLEQATKALSLTSALDGGGWSTPRPGRFTPRERDPSPIV